MFFSLSFGGFTILDLQIINAMQIYDTPRIQGRSWEDEGRVRT